MTGDVMLGGVMEFLTKYRFLGNHLGQWLLLLAILLLSLVLGRLISFFLLRRANRLVQVEGWKVLELLLRCVERPVGLVLLAGGLYVAGQFMTLAPPHYALWNKVCQTIAALAGGWLLFRLVAVVEHYLARWTSRTETLLDDQLVPLVRKALRVFVVIVALLFVADNVFNWDIGALVAGLGIGGLAFALAGRDMLANLFGSATIFADRPFGMGDWVELAGYSGIIEEVGFRSTRIRALNGHLVTVPNAAVANASIENISARPYQKRILDITVTYDTPPDKVERAVAIIKEMFEAREEHFHRDYPPRAYFSDFNAESLNIQVYYWFVPPDWWAYMAFNHDFNMELLRRFNEEGIEFAFPTRTLYVKQGSPTEADVRLAPRDAGRNGSQPVVGS